MKLILIVSDLPEAVNFFTAIEEFTHNDEFTEIHTTDLRAYNFLRAKFESKVKRIALINESKDEANNINAFHFVYYLQIFSLFLKGIPIKKIIVFGGSLISYCAAVAAFYEKIEVMHIDSQEYLADFSYQKMIARMANKKFWFQTAPFALIESKFAEFTSEPLRRFSQKMASAKDVLNVLVVFGTRPEAIKMAPLIAELAKTQNICLKVCFTGQHKDLALSMISFFGIYPDFKLEIMKPGQTLIDITTSVVSGVSHILSTNTIDYVFVHGDTSTAYAAAFAAHCHHVPVGHVEAGLRTGDFLSPFPEEWNRTQIATIGKHHFSPTINAANNLLLEKVPTHDIFVTGNTVVDALRYTRSRISSNPVMTRQYEIKFSEEIKLDPTRKTILLTAHRSENKTELANICEAILLLAKRADIQFLIPLHPNPTFKVVLSNALRGYANIHLVDALPYQEVVYLMKNHINLIVTDSGGLQEEAPTFKIPLFVMRASTERPEAAKCGAAKIVGTDPIKLCASINSVLDHPAEYKKMSSIVNPYGDGKAAENIVGHLIKVNSRQQETKAKNLRRYRTMTAVGSGMLAGVVMFGILGGYRRMGEANSVAKTLSAP